jgi:glycerol-1-phosphate dehydrogenase [NAD(P)+]
MPANPRIAIPSLVRIKPGALGRIGIYLKRAGYERVRVLTSPLPRPVAQAARDALAAGNVLAADWTEIDGNSFENAVSLFAGMSGTVDAVVGIGGGKALDCAKYLAFLARLPYLAVPTSLSNDGFCSPQSSLTMGGRRRSLPAALPQGVVIDVSVCLGAPKTLWLSGVGDLVSKLTAVVDWKLAFHNRGEPINDFAALLSDATVYQFMSRPTFDERGTALLGTALMLNGISMDICGSSRPASGSEHLVSPALDAVSARPRPHGIQVGVAAYIVSHLQRTFPEQIDRLFQATGFWEAVRQDPLSRAEWLEALRMAPSMKENFFSVLCLRDCLPEATALIDADPALRGCFTA